MKRLGLIIGVGALLLGAAPSWAQRPELPVALVDQVTSVARAALPSAVLEDGSNVPPETAAERSQPIVPRALEVQTIERGILTAEMEFCGLDWQGLSYQPYMQTLRRRYRGKPMAYVGMLHGITQGILGGELARQHGVCSDEMRSRLTAEAASRPIDVP
jgi:hypothetical protein